MDLIQTVAGIETPAEATSAVVDDQETRVPAAGKPGTAEMGELPVEDWDYQRPKRGEVRSGVILSIGDQEIIVDVGGKRDGIVPYADIQRLGKEEVAKLSVGDEVLVYVLRPEDQDGNLLLSLNMARQEQAWRRAQKLAETGEVWESEVIGYNKGGLVVPLDEIRGFVPASQVPGFPRGLNQEERLKRLSEMVGEILQVKVIEINRRKRRLILSATTALRQWRRQERQRLLDELREGEVRQGRVSSICSFGAFVDLGGADGLVHLSELSWRRVRHPREVVNVGDEVEVYILRLDQERRRIGLSLKRLQPEPWALVEDKYELGQLVEGVVTNVVDFGAFAEIEEGVEGLIHVSELAESSVSHPKEVVRKGDLLLLRIIRIDVRRKRLGLSLKRVLESEWAEWAARLAAAEAERKAAAAAQQPPEAEEVERALEEAPEALIEAGEPAEPEAEEVEGAVEEAPEALIEAGEPTEPEVEEIEGAMEEAPEALIEAGEPAEPEVEEIEGAMEEAPEALIEAGGPAEPEVEEVEGVVEEAPEALVEAGESAEPEAEEVEGVVEEAPEALIEVGELAEPEAGQDELVEALAGEWAGTEETLEPHKEEELETLAEMATEASSDAQEGAEQSQVEEANPSDTVAA